MLISTANYGVCSVIREISENYYELEARDDSFFFKEGTRFRAYLVGIEPKGAIQMDLLDGI